MIGEGNIAARHADLFCVVDHQSGEAQRKRQRILCAPFDVNYVGIVERILSLRNLLQTNRASMRRIGISYQSGRRTQDLFED